MFLKDVYINIKPIKNSNVLSLETAFYLYRWSYIMNIMVECINLNKSSFDYFISNEDNSYYNSYYDSGDDTVTCRFSHSINNSKYHLPDCSVTLLDLLSFSKNMKPKQVYNCVLELSSFITVELYTNHRNSIRGMFWNCVPEKYVPDYSFCRNQQCIEIDGDIILIAPYNNLLSGTRKDGDLIEVIPQSPLNLRTVRS